MWEVQRDRRMGIWDDTPIKGPPAFTPGSIMRHRGTCLRSPDAFAPHRVLTRQKVLRSNLPQHMRPAGPPLGKSLSMGPP